MFSPTSVHMGKIWLHILTQYQSMLESLLEDSLDDVIASDIQTLDDAHKVIEGVMAPLSHAHIDWDLYG